MAIGSAAKYSHSRPKVRCGLPSYDYQVAQYSRTVRAVSNEAIDVPVPAPGPVPVPEAVPTQSTSMPAVAEGQVQRLLADAVDALRQGKPLPDLTPLQTIAASDPQLQRVLDAIQAQRPGEPLPMPPPIPNISPTDISRIQGALQALPALDAANLLTQIRTNLRRTDLLSGAKAFQFASAPVLKIDHCSISEMSVQIQDSGAWELSLRADQNPADAQADRKVTTKEEIRKFTDHLQRNQFFVRLQCYANFGRAGRVGLLGKPVVIPLNVEPFWVQKGVPLPLVVQGYSPKVKSYFSQIDRAEIEFYYRIN
jgi:multidrug efflux pump subunit AcrA (membrane-fusion protein)